MMGSAPAPLSFEAQVREGYLANAIVQRAVRLVAEAAGSAPLVASDPALAALVSANSGGQGLVETLASQLLLHGNGYVQILTDGAGRSEEHTSELQSLMRISYAFFCLKKKNKLKENNT